MDPIETLSSVSPGRDTAVTIGVFDGVHLGHRHLMESLARAADNNGLASLVVTFVNHPRTVLAPGSTVPLITSVEERLSLLKGTGIDKVVPLTFTIELSRLTAKEFAGLLVEKLRMKRIVAAPDFAMGRGRQGTIARLKTLGETAGFAVETIDSVLIAGKKVSSTVIRQQLSKGEVAQAARFLGRAPSLEGLVVTGDKRGRQIGFPTANVDVPPEILLPADGIYCTIAHVDGKARLSVTNIGVRPTFGVGKRLVEVHIPDFSGDLYGKRLRIDLVERIRDEKRFSGVEELKQAIAGDIEKAKELFQARVKA